MTVLLLIKVLAEGFLSVLWGSFSMFCEPSDWRMNPERTSCEDFRLYIVRKRGESEPR